MILLIDRVRPRRHRLRLQRRRRPGRDRLAGHDAEQVVVDQDGVDGPHAGPAAWRRHAAPVLAACCRPAGPRARCCRDRAKLIGPADTDAPTIDTRLQVEPSQRLEVLADCRPAPPASGSARPAAPCRCPVAVSVTVMPAAARHLQVLTVVLGDPDPQGARSDRGRDGARVVRRQDRRSPARRGVAAPSAPHCDSPWPCPKPCPSIAIVPLAGTLYVSVVTLGRRAAGTRQQQPMQRSRRRPPSSPTPAVIPTDRGGEPWGGDGGNWISSRTVSLRRSVRQPSALTRGQRVQNAGRADRNGPDVTAATARPASHRSPSVRRTTWRARNRAPCGGRRRKPRRRSRRPARTAAASAGCDQAGKHPRLTLLVIARPGLRSARARRSGTRRTAAAASSRRRASRS